MANWYQFTLCQGDNPALFIAGLKAHEGWGTTHHNGHYSAAWDVVTNPATDPLIFLDEQVGGSKTTFDSFVRDLRGGFIVRAARADSASLDVINGGQIVKGNWSGILWLWSGDHFVQSQHSN
ncbi:MAG TPA: hypothetical protein VFJ82_13570 [Longimicrobium sp.]|nr:hypothetical protein [Longimicrobium sp.]